MQNLNLTRITLLSILILFLHPVSTQGITSTTPSLTEDTTTIDATTPAPSAPAAPMNVSGVSSQQTITVSWEYAANITVGGFTVRCDPAIGSQCSSESGTDLPDSDKRNTTFTAAVYGQAYTFSVQAYYVWQGYGRLESDWVNTSSTVVLAPSAVTNLTSTDLSDDSITFQWRTGEGRADGFDVTLSSNTTDIISVAVADTPTTSGDLHNITISNLTADTEYTVIVTSKASDGGEPGGFIRGAGVNYTTLTLQLEPGPVTNLTSTAITSDRITVTWSPPDPLNSVVAFAIRVLKGDVCQSVTIMDCPTCESRREEHSYDFWSTLLDCGVPNRETIDRIDIERQFTVESLSPVTYYSIELYALNTRNSTQSESINVTTDLATPDDAPLVRVDGSTYNTINITWNAINDRFGDIQYYTVSYKKDSRITNSRRFDRTSDSTYQYQLIDLSPYTLYNISVRASNSKGDGPPGEISRRTGEYIPGPPASLTLTPYQTQIRASWTEPDEKNGIIEQYRVTYYRAGEANVNRTYETSSPSSLLRDLIQPYREYVVEVRARTGYDGYGEAKSATVTTPQAAPSVPPTVYTQTGSYSIRIEWDEINSEQRNGVITHHQITLNTMGVYDTVQTDGPVMSHVLSGLQANTHYTVGVRACTLPGCSGYQYETVKTEEGAPLGGSVPDSIRSELPAGPPTKTQISFRLPANPEDAGFNTSAGMIREIQILVLADSQTNSDIRQSGLGTESHTTKWSDAQKRSFTGAYAVGDKVNSSESWRLSGRKKRAIAVLSDTITVGDADSCRRNKPEYCNGALKPSTDYCIYLRGFTAGGYADTECLVQTRTLTDPAPIAAPVVVVLILLVISAVVVVVIYRRRQGNGSEERTTTDQPIYENSASVPTGSSSSTQPVYENTGTQPNQGIYENTALQPAQDDNYEMVVSSPKSEQGKNFGKTVALQPPGKTAALQPPGKTEALQPPGLRDDKQKMVMTSLVNELATNQAKTTALLPPGYRDKKNEMVVTSPVYEQVNKQQQNEDDHTYTSFSKP